MPTNRTATGKWKSTRRALITAAKRRGELNCANCARALDDNAPRCTPNAIEVDHILPVSCGGTDDRENLQLMCFPCNRAKSDGRTAVAGHQGTLTRTVLRRSGSLRHVDCHHEAAHDCTPTSCPRAWPSVTGKLPSWWPTDRPRPSAWVVD